MEPVKMNDAASPIDEEEFNTAQKEATKDTEASLVMKLKKPLDYNGKKYEELHFDFESLTGGDSLEVENEIQVLTGRVVVASAFNTEYLIGISCRACAEPIGTDAFKKMSLYDFNRIRDKARNFLLRSEQ